MLLITMIGAAPAWLTCGAIGSPLAVRDSLYTDTWRAMGTEFRIELQAPSRPVAEHVIRDVRDEIERVEQLLSDYRPTSELSRLNRIRTVTVDPEMFSLLDRLDRLVHLTHGGFDPAVGRLVDAWGFRSANPGIPTDSVLQAARRCTGWARVRRDRSVRGVDLGCARLDPGAFGKGYALDRAAALLVSHGIKSALLDAGGSTFVAVGAPPGKAGWRVVIGERSEQGTDDGAGAHDRDVDRASRRDRVVDRSVDRHRAGPAVAWLRDEALSVSGQSGRRFYAAGVEYGHILDPRTGFPAAPGRIVAVRGKSALDTDAVSTGLYVLWTVDAERVLDASGLTGALFLDGQADDPVSIRWQDR